MVDHSRAARVLSCLLVLLAVWSVRAADHAGTAPGNCFISLDGALRAALDPVHGRAGLAVVVARDRSGPLDEVVRTVLSRTGMFVHVFAPDATVRDALGRSAAWSPDASRVIVARDTSPALLPHATNLADLICACSSARSADSATIHEYFRVLAPHGRMVFVSQRDEGDGNGGPGIDVVRRTAASAGFEDIRVLRFPQGGVLTARKPVPSGMDDWPQFLHGADGNAVSHDRFIGPPRCTQWTAGPRWSRDHDVTPSIFGLTSAGGRIFYIQDEGPVSVIDARLPEKRFLICRDAFNGALLWKYRLRNWFSSRVIWGHIPVSSERRVAVTATRVYVTPGIGDPVTALDAASGRVIRVFHGTENASEIVLDGDVLAAVIRPESPLIGKTASRDRRRFRPGFPGLPDGAQSVVMVRTETGEVLWKKNYHALPLSLVIGGGRVVFGEKDEIVCVDRNTGAEVWRAKGRAETIVIHDDVVAAGAWVQAPSGKRPAYHPKGRRTVLRAYSLKDGRVLWTKEGDYLPTFMFFRVPVDIYVTNGDVVWGVGRGLEWNKRPGTGILPGFDLHTGAEVVRRDLTGAFTAGHHVRCYRSKATDRFLMFNKRGIEFVETKNGRGSVQIRWVRGVCRYGIMPANGLIYAPPQACVCYPETRLDGFSALSAADPAADRTPPPEPRLERGPAYDHAVAETPPAPDDWPMYRHDPRRSGACPTDVPTDLKALWFRYVGAHPTPPVVARGSVYVADRSSGVLTALDADSGVVRWRFAAGGEIDSPPVLWRNRVLFGCRDGRVYCLLADNGALVWSFLAAPGFRTVSREGRPESAWPVHGSVLLFNGRVYAAAGRTSEVDGGLDVYALDPASGRAIHHIRIVGPDEQTIRDGGGRISSGRMPGARNDILLTNGKKLFLRHVPLAPELSSPSIKDLTWGAKGPDHFLATSGFLDDTFFNRSVWQYGRYVQRSQLLVFDDKAVYGVRVYSGISWNCPIWNLGEGYLVFRRPYKPPASAGKKKPPVRAGRRMLFPIRTDLFSWSRRMHVLIRGMVKTGTRPDDELIFVAGSPEAVGPQDPFAAFESRLPARLLALKAGTGEIVRETALPVPPVFDGLIAARGRLYISLHDGRLVCLGRRE